MQVVTLPPPQKTIYGANVIVFEGILAFANKELLKVMNTRGDLAPTTLLGGDQAAGLF